MAKITQVQALVTKTGTFDGASIAIDNTVFPTVPNWTLCVEIQNSGPDTYTRFMVSDSVNAFANWEAGPTFVSVGAISVGSSKKVSFQQKDFPDLRFGVASAVLRLSIISITGTSPSVTYSSWFEI